VHLVAERSARAAVDDPANRFCRELGLRHKPGCLARGDQIREVRLRMGRDQDHRRSLGTAFLDQAACQVDAALPPKRDIDEKDVGAELLGQPKRLGAVRGDAHDAQALSLEENSRRSEEGSVVIDDEDAESHTISVASDKGFRIAASRNLESSGSRARGSLLPSMTTPLRRATLLADDSGPPIAEERTMEPIVMPTTELDGDEDLLVHNWRAEQLRRLGVHRASADAFAGLVDWHEIADLVARGCSPELALEIVR
jgi:hypothetical protein